MVSLYLKASTPFQLTDYVTFPNGQCRVDSVHGCQIKLVTFPNQVCRRTRQLLPGKIYRIPIPPPLGYELWVTTQSSFAQAVINHQTMTFYTLPEQWIQVPQVHENQNIGHTWTWNQPTPGAILLPNLNNDPRLYLPLKFPHFVTTSKHPSRQRVSQEMSYYLGPDMTMHFYLENLLPVSVYDRQGHVVLGHNLTTGHYSPLSPPLTMTATYFLSCNELISRHTQPIIRISIGLFRGQQLLLSDHLICHLAPLIFPPVTQPINMIYLSEMLGVHGNQTFLRNVIRICRHERLPYTIIRDPRISSYHRWLQDIMKFASVTDGHTTQQVILKGPNYSREQDVSYLRSYFATIPQYDLIFEGLNNLDGFGNVQVSPPIRPDYPLGRIIYGVSHAGAQKNLSYHLSDLLESQQVQSPIQIETSWLLVGHVDEVVAFVPDDSQVGFRMLIVSPRKFYQLLDQLDPQTICFKGRHNHYLFDTLSSEVTSRFSPEIKNTCIYRSQLKVKDLLNWKELREDNQNYQIKLDVIRHTLTTQLRLKPSQVFEIPICYWPRSIATRAKAVFPNLINHLYGNGVLIAPKPYGPKVGKVDIFEDSFQQAIPSQIHVYFVSDWDHYYLLDGDIHCGTNVMRAQMSHPWWMMQPPGAYNV
uniref:Protein-arginine deiminase C-terminal domain-containing protein n=1 Tax=viral metagenome TaxID=1070528 RepID=A0A6C0BKL8_9ZZZZ